MMTPYLSRTKRRIALDNFHFIRPEWFWALLALPIIWKAAKSIYQSQAGWDDVIPQHLRQHLLSTTAQHSNQFDPTHLIIAASVLAITGLADPMGKATAASI